MSKQQIDELVSEYLEAELWDAETRLATGAWEINDAEDQGDWNDVAQTLVHVRDNRDHPEAFRRPPRRAAISTDGTEALKRMPQRLWGMCPQSH